MRGLKNTTGVVLGVANEKSICWGAVLQAIEAGADPKNIILLVQNETYARRVRPLAAEVGIEKVLLCDLERMSPEDPYSLFAVAEQVKEMYGEKSINWMLHGAAFSDRAELDGRLLDTSAPNFVNTMLISVYSFIRMVKVFENLLADGASIVTLTFRASRHPFVNYNVMGLAKAALEACVRGLALDLGPERKVRVNAISSGTVRTLAAAGISEYQLIGDSEKARSPLGGLVAQEDVGAVIVFALSPDSATWTGEVISADGGVGIPGMIPPANAEIEMQAMMRMANITHGRSSTDNLEVLKGVVKHLLGGGEVKLVGPTDDKMREAGKMDRTPPGA